MQGFWCLLNLIEFLIYFALLDGTLYDRNTLGRREKNILYVGVIVYGVILSVQSGSVFSYREFLVSLILMILAAMSGGWKTPVLSSGIALIYNATMTLLLYSILFLLALFCGNAEQSILTWGLLTRPNEFFCLLRIPILLIAIVVVSQIRKKGLRGRIRQYQNVMLICGVLLSGLVLEYQKLLKYSLQYSTTGIALQQDILKGSTLSFVTAMVLIATLGILVLNNQNIRNENEFLQIKEELERKKYEEIYNAVEKNKELVHDTKNHFLVISEYEKNREYEKLHEYIEDLKSSFIKINPQIYTGNQILDLILSQKQMTAAQKEIDLRIKTTLLGKLAFEEKEICALFGNLLDNALEACEMVAEKEKRHSEIRIEQHKHMLFIEVSNSKNKGSKQTDKNRNLFKRAADFQTTKKNTSIHGYGLKIIEQIVNRYEGEIEYKVEEEKFCVAITFFYINT